MAFSVVANWQQSDKVEHGCTITNLPLSNGIKIVSVLQRLHGEIGRTISDIQKREKQTDRQTDKQTKKLNVFGNAASNQAVLCHNGHNASIQHSIFVPFIDYIQSVI